MSCEICTIITDSADSEQALRLIEGEYWRATLRQSDQTLLATSYVTAKRHVPSLAELSADEWTEFSEINARLERAITQSFGASVMNTACLMNLTFQRDDPSPHVHWHIKPRYAAPVRFNETTFADPMFGSYLDGQYDRQPVSDTLAAAIVSEIKSHL